MQHRDRRRYQMLARVRAFGEVHRDLFPPDSEVHDAFALVGTAIAELDALGVSEGAAARAVRAATKGAARRALLDTLLRVMQTADVMQVDTVERSWKAVLPARADGVQLLTAARYTRERATPFAVRFAAHGIPLEELDQRIADFVRATSEHYSAASGGTMERVAIDTAVTRAMRAVAALDVSIANYFGSDAAINAAWKQARTLGFKHRKRGHGKKKTALAARQPLAALPASSGLSAVMQFLLSKLRRRSQLPPPDVEVDVIEPPRKRTRLLGP